MQLPSFSSLSFHHFQSVKMRDMVTCFSEHAIRVSETTCSSNSLQNQHQSPTPALQNAVVTVYRITQTQTLVKLTWSRTQLSITLDEDNSTTFKLNIASRIFPKKKGARSITHNASKIDLFWDLTEPIFESSVEPVQGYYIIIFVDSELGLLLGDPTSSKIFRNLNSAPKFSLLCRREHYSGSGLYSTKARFSEGGAVHEIAIQSGSNVLWVSVDKKTVVKVKRLQWNFRGNQTIFLDGLVVDLMWDVHGWLFGNGSGIAVFLFRRRDGFDTRLWLQEKSPDSAQKQVQDESYSEFSLMICATKTPSIEREVNQV